MQVIDAKIKRLKNADDRGFLPSLIKLLMCLKFVLFSRVFPLRHNFLF